MKWGSLSETLETFYPTYPDFVNIHSLFPHNEGFCSFISYLGHHLLLQRILLDYVNICSFDWHCLLFSIVLFMPPLRGGWLRV